MKIEVLVTPEHIFATDGKQHEVIKLDMNGIIVKSVGGRGTNPGQLNFPNGIRQSKKKEIYVCDSISF